MDEQAKKLQRDVLAGEILLLARASLLLHLRFMEGAIGRLSFEPLPRGTVCTDGRRFLYSPQYVLLRYQAERTAPTRDFLHCVLHCVFRHMYLHQRVDRRLWSLACDIMVENLIADLGVRAATTKRQSEQQVYVDTLRSAVKPLTAEKLYAIFWITPCRRMSLQGWNSSSWRTIMRHGFPVTMTRSSRTSGIRIRRTRRCRTRRRWSLSRIGKTWLRVFRRI